ncbi:MAG: S41 family peptidase [Rickettsiales bacterium]|nr:S41 family peptidase [Rickettsiales bacterium]
MKKLFVVNIFLLLLVSSVYALNSDKIQEYVKIPLNQEKSSISNTNIAASNTNILAKVKKQVNLKSKQNYELAYKSIVDLIKRDYVEDIDDDKFFELSINGLLSGLDPHSTYLNKKEFDQIKVETDGKFSGLGIVVSVENGMIKVISPIDDTPAFKAGIKAGDYISSINSKSTLNMGLEEAVNMMRGKNEKDRGEVKLTILRKGEKEPLELKMKRDIIKTESAKARNENNIIYLRLSTFTNETYSEMIKEFNRVENEIGKDKVKGLVLDLRNNPGGLLDSSILISDSFLDKGQKVVSIKGKNDVLLQEYKAQNEQDLIPNLPMVVLINEGSASASEIVAGALQDNKRAIVLGTQSFGKGSVQSIIDSSNFGLDNGSAIKLTIARYYTPSGKSIQAEGIKPDIEVKLAKLEEIDLSKWSMKENDLKGHLKNEQDVVEKEIQKQLQTKNESMYNKDYQLARAIDLLLGIDFYNQKK